MSPTSLRVRLPVVCMLLGTSFALRCFAERGFVVVQVHEINGRPVRGIEIGVKGVGGSGGSGDDGKVKLPIGGGTRENDLISLTILHSPSGSDFVIMSPDEGRDRVPPFDDKPDSFMSVLVIERGDRSALEKRGVVSELAKQIDRKRSTRTESASGALGDSKVGLADVAKAYGLSPTQLDRAIRAFNERTVGPYDAGMAAYYRRDYAASATQLEEFLKQERDEPIARKKVGLNEQARISDAEFFLGSSLQFQGKYSEAAEAYQKCLQIRGDDPALLNNLGNSLAGAGDLPGAKSFYRQALAVSERVFGPDSLYAAASLNNLANVFETESHSSEAEPLYRRALGIREKLLGTNHPDVAQILNNQAAMFDDNRRYAEAEPLYWKALSIYKSVFGSDSLEVATCRLDLANLFSAERKFDQADHLYLQSLSAFEKTLGPNHPFVAKVLANRALMFGEKEDFAEARKLYTRALRIDEKTLGPDHPDVADCLNALGYLLKIEGNYSEAEPILRRALAIDQKKLGPDHPRTRNVQANLNNVIEKSAKEKQTEK